MQKYLTAESRWLFSRESFIIDVWQGSKYTFDIMLSIRLTRVLWLSSKTTKVEYRHIMNTLWIHIERTKKIHLPGYNFFSLFASTAIELLFLGLIKDSFLLSAEVLGITIKTSCLNPLSTNPTRWSNTFWQLTLKTCEQIVWVCLVILWGWPWTG